MSMSSNRTKMAQGQQSHTGTRKEGVVLVKHNSMYDIGEPQWVIDGILPDEAVSMLYGPSGKGKTFQGLDWAFCVATGRKWNGHAVKQGEVVYVAGEGQRGYSVRLMAWEQKHEAVAEAFTLCSTPVRLWRDPESMQAFLDAVNAEGIHPALVVFDTLGNCLGGANENSNGDMRELLDNAERIVREWRCAVLLVHHTPKRSFSEDIRKRDVPRGAQTLQDGVAMHTYLDGDGKTYATLTCTKQKDTEQFKPIRRSLFKVVLDKKADSLCFADEYKTGPRDTANRRVSWADIRAVLEGSAVPMTPKDIADALGLGALGRKTIRNHLMRATDRDEAYQPDDDGAYALNPRYAPPTAGPADVELIAA
jgi:AAA domain-containing protein